MTTLRLKQGDACLILRDDGQIWVAHDPPPLSDAALAILGLAMALSDDKWTARLIERTRSHIAQQSN